VLCICVWYMCDVCGMNACIYRYMCMSICVCSVYSVCVLWYVYI
jgi:hypothetical protein